MKKYEPHISCRPLWKTHIRSIFSFEKICFFGLVVVGLAPTLSDPTTKKNTYILFVNVDVKILTFLENALSPFLFSRQIHEIA